MSRPKVDVIITNDNLGLRAPSEDGYSVVLVAAPVAPTVGYGVALLVTTLAEIKTQFSAVGNEPVIEAFEKGFFAEAPEGTKVVFLAMAPATNLETLFAAVNAEKALNLAAGDACLLAAIKFPAGGYTPVITEGFDADVHNAVVDAQTLAAAWNAKKKGFRYFIQGYGYTGAAAAIDYKEEAYRNGGIVVGSVADETATATLLALGRAARIQIQENMGKVKTGSLNIDPADSVKIGATEADQVSDADLNLLHQKRYITFEKNEIASGYIWSDDNTLTSVTDDYNNFRHGRIIDKAQRIANREYYEELKDDVEVDENGRLSIVSEKALETKIESAIDDDMRANLSKRKDGSADVTCLINPPLETHAALYAKNNITPNFNIIQSETIYLFLFLKPKGSLKYINVYVGLTATSI